MGYYSYYNGSYEPSNKLTEAQVIQIRDWFKQRFGDYVIHECGSVMLPEVDGKTEWYMGDIYFDYRNNKGVVYPTEDNFKGYDFNEHLYEFNEFAKSIGITYKGEVEWQGEDHDDLERIAIVDGKVLSYKAKVVWCDPQEVNQTEAQKNAMFDALFK